MFILEKSRFWGIRMAKIVLHMTQYGMTRTIYVIYLTRYSNGRKLYCYGISVRIRNDARTCFRPLQKPFVYKYEFCVVRETRHGSHLSISNPSKRSFKTHSRDIVNRIVI